MRHVAWGMGAESIGYKRAYISIMLPVCGIPDASPPHMPPATFLIPYVFNSAKSRNSSKACGFAKASTFFTGRP
jgi:hypothetical protein